MEEYFIKRYSKDSLDIIKSPLSYSSIRFNTLKITAQEALKELTQLYDNFIIELHPALNDTIIIESQGPYEVTPVFPEVYVDYKCGEAVLRGSSIYSPGVLGSSLNCNKKLVKEKEKVSVFSIKHERPRGFKDQIQNTEAKIFLGNGIVQMSRKQVFGLNKGLAIRMTETKFSLPSFDCLNPGLFYPQNLGSITVGHILNPLPNSTILDMCAAPGGKTSHLFTLMKNTGNLTALDKSSSRLTSLRKHLQAWGADSVNVQKMDSTQVYKYFGDCFFDKVLLDAPCSGLGQRPRLNLEKISLEKASVYQKSLLIAASRVLKISGELVYSTCSISEEENQENVIWALKNLPLELTEQSLYLGDRSYPEGKTQVFSLLEHSGFFIASFKKI